MLLFDTNILTKRLLSPFLDKAVEDPSKLLSFLQKVKDVDIVVPSFIVAEYEIIITRVAPSRYKFTKEDRLELLESLQRDIQEINCFCTIYSPTIKEYLRASQLFCEQKPMKLSFTDCWLLAVVESKKHPLLTLDKALKKTAQKMALPIANVA